KTASCIHKFLFRHPGREVLFAPDVRDYSHKLLGAWGTTYAYTTEQYPTMARGTGAGWAMGIGRIGGIVGPTVVGALLASHDTVSSVFWMFTIVLIVVAVAVAWLGRETRGRTMADIEMGQ
ncbi:MFS transporter, partial [Sulfobacillus harzensis]